MTEKLESVATTQAVWATNYFPWIVLQERIFFSLELLYCEDFFLGGGGGGECRIWYLDCTITWNQGSKYFCANI